MVGYFWHQRSLGLFSIGGLNSLKDIYEPLVIFALAVTQDLVQLLLLPLIITLRRDRDEGLSRYAEDDVLLLESLIGSLLTELGLLLCKLTFHILSTEWL